MVDGERGARVVAGRYALTDVLGRGGMGTVWLATDRVLERKVAMKEITFSVELTDEERGILRERTMREARAAAKLDHPCVTTVYGDIEHAGLRLITCGGSFDSSARSYDDNIVVFAELDRVAPI